MPKQGKHEYLRISSAPDHLFDAETWFKVTTLSCSENINEIYAIQEPHHYEDVLSYVFDTSEGLVIFDVGFGLANIAKVIKEKSETKPVKVFLTHSDWDHVGGLKDLIKEFPQTETFIFDPYESFSQIYGTVRVENGWSLTEMGGLEPDHFTKEFKEQTSLPSQKALDSFFLPGFPQALPLEFLPNQDDITFEYFGLTITAIQTPGHTPDSICFFIHQTGDLITGDTLYPGPEYLRMPGSDPKKYLASLEQLQKLLGNKIKRILPGHNKPMSKPSLLTAHILALKNELPVKKIEYGSDQFGSFVKKSFVSDDGEEFALMLAA